MPKKFVKLTKFLKWHWIFSLGKWHWFLAISKFSLGKKVNAKSVNFTEKSTCTAKFFPVVYLVNHVEINDGDQNFWCQKCLTLAAKEELGFSSRFHSLCWRFPQNEVVKYPSMHSSSFKDSGNSLQIKWSKLIFDTYHKNVMSLTKE